MGAERFGCPFRRRPLYRTSSLDLIVIMKSLASSEQILPFITPLAYFFVLPPPERFVGQAFSVAEDEEDDAAMSASYVPLARSEDEDDPSATEPDASAKGVTSLTIQDKWRLAKPMLTKYMLPLCEFPYAWRITRR